ncbi:MAG: sigma-70 family RNA polymerase sigma factor [Bacteroidota bacterium]
MLLLDALLLLLAVQASPDLDDQVLAERIKRGDERAFRIFFERHQQTLWHYLIRRGVPSDPAADLVQQAFVTIWKRRDTIDQGKSLRSLLFTIGHNRGTNYFRDTKKFTSDAVLTTAAAEERTEGEAMHNQMLETLHAAVARLPERRRAVFELCFMQQLTYREAAEVLSVSIKTIENQMGHALKAVRAAMQRYREP